MLPRLFQVCLHPSIPNSDIIRSFFCSQNAIFRAAPTRDCLIVRNFSSFDLFKEFLLTLDNSCVLLNSNILVPILKQSNAQSTLSLIISLLKNKQSLFSISLLKQIIHFSPTLSSSELSCLSTLLPLYSASMSTNNCSLIVANSFTYPDFEKRLPVLATGFLTCLESFPVHELIDLTQIYSPNFRFPQFIIQPFSGQVFLFLQNSPDFDVLMQLIVENGGNITDTFSQSVTSILIDENLIDSSFISSLVGLEQIPLYKSSLIMSKLTGITSEDDFLISIDTLKQWALSRVVSSQIDSNLFSGCVVVFCGVSSNLLQQLSNLIVSNGGTITPTPMAATICVVSHGFFAPVDLHTDCVVVSPEWVSLSVFFNSLLHLSVHKVLSPLTTSPSVLIGLFSKHETIKACLLNCRDEIRKHCHVAALELLNISVVERLSPSALPALAFLDTNVPFNPSDNKLSKLLNYCIAKSIPLVSIELIDKCLDGESVDWISNQMSSDAINAFKTGSLSLLSSRPATSMSLHVPSNVHEDRALVDMGKMYSQFDGVNLTSKLGHVGYNY
ncbi:hypothetical protein RCL1_003033 [Eukaryota sp. TZLM3-RCL]